MKYEVGEEEGKVLEHLCTNNIINAVMQADAVQSSRVEMINEVTEEEGKVLEHFVYRYLLVRWSVAQHGMNDSAGFQRHIFTAMYF